MALIYVEGQELSKIPVQRNLCANLNLNELLEMPLGILNEDGSIELTSYQLRNIHEFLKAYDLAAPSE